MRSRTARKLPWAFIRCSRQQWEGGLMPDLSINFCGVRSPNPFWLASGPPTNTAYQVMRAFETGWGGALWKTICEPIINTGSRYGELELKNERKMGLNNIELFSDRQMEVNFRAVRHVE